MNEHDYAVILAAGKGTRMHSQIPKVLHTILGEPMLSLVLHAARNIFSDRVFVVAGHGAEAIKAAFPDANIILQTVQLGTGHALLSALPNLKQAQARRVTILNGDVPLLTPHLLQHFIGESADADLAFATIILDDPASYGRVVRKDGRVCAIVEAKDYDEAAFGPPTGEVNAGLYNFDLEKIAPLVPLIENTNASGEYYITDLVELALKKGLDVKGCPMPDSCSLLGVNSPKELAACEDHLATTVTECLLQKGVCLHNPGAVRISPLVEVEPGANISGPCEIFGDTHILSGAVIEAFCQIADSRIDAARIHSFCHIRGATIAQGCRVGPFARLRPGAVLEENVHVGDFVELKQTLMHPGAKANHLSYLGDSEIGMNTNIGAGTITCNYDGRKKHRTNIGQNVFIGSNTALVAPVAIGNGATVGAGSTITKNVPENDLGIARAKQVNLPWPKK